jgi:WD40 repeat protein
MIAGISLSFTSCEDVLSPRYVNPLDRNSSAYVPTTPSGLMASVVNDSLTTLRWTDKSTGEQGFKIYMSVGSDTVFRLIASVDSNAIVYNDTVPKIHDLLYVYRLYSYSSTGLSKSFSSATVQFSFQAPTFTFFGGSDSTTLTIGWRSNTPFPSETQLERKGPGGFEVLDIVPPGISTAADPSVNKYQIFQYRLSSRTRFNESVYSDTTSAVYQCLSAEQVGSIQTGNVFNDYLESSRDGSAVLCKTLLNDIEVLDLRTERPLRTFAFSQKISNATLSGDGQILGVALKDTGMFNFYSASTGQLIRTIQVPPPALDLAISNDGSRVMTSSADTVIRIWNIGDGSLVGSLIGGTSSPVSLSLSDDGLTLISGSGSNIRLWDWQSGQLLRITQGGYFSKPVFLMRSGDVYQVEYDYEAIIIHNLSQNKAVAALHAPYYTSPGFLTSDGSTLVAGGVGEFFIYNLINNQMVQRIHFPAGGIYIARTASDSTFIATDLNSSSPFALFLMKFGWTATSARSSVFN